MVRRWNGKGNLASESVAKEKNWCPWHRLLIWLRKYRRRDHRQIYNNIFKKKKKLPHTVTPLKRKTACYAKNSCGIFHENVILLPILWWIWEKKEGTIKSGSKKKLICWPWHIWTGEIDFRGFIDYIRWLIISWLLLLMVFFLPMMAMVLRLPPCSYWTGSVPLSCWHIYSGFYRRKAFAFVLLTAVPVCPMRRKKRILRFVIAEGVAQAVNGHGLTIAHGGDHSSITWRTSEELTFRLVQMVPSSIPATIPGGPFGVRRFRYPTRSPQPWNGWGDSWWTKWSIFVSRWLIQHTADKSGRGRRRARRVLTVLHRDDSSSFYHDIVNRLPRLLPNPSAGRASRGNQLLWGRCVNLHLPAGPERWWRMMNSCQGECQIPLDLTHRIQEQAPGHCSGGCP